MEDLNFLQNFFSALKTIMYVFLAFIIVGTILSFSVGEIALVPCFIGLIVWGMLMIELWISEIILTRFVAMTENIFEITQMLEKKFEINND